MRRKHNSNSMDHQLDNTVSDSFPASDPPAHSGITGIGRRNAPAERSKTDLRPPTRARGDDARPTGHPTSDRHAT